MRTAEEKLIPWQKANELSAQLRQQGLRLVTTNGCFDLLHLGHLEYLAQARALGDRLWIGLNSDASVRKLKGPSRPIQNQQTRALQMAALEAVDYVTVFEQDTPEEFLGLVQPSVHAKGGDYRVEDLPERKVVEASGGKITCLAFIPGFSTTSLIEKLKHS